MNFLLKLIDMIGGFNGIKKVFDGKKTYLTCAAMILGGAFWIVWTAYLFGQKQVDANAAYVQITVCAAAIGDAFKSIFARMAQAKHDALLKAVQDTQKGQISGHTTPDSGALAGGVVPPAAGGAK